MEMLESDASDTMEPVRTGLKNIMSDLLRTRPVAEAAVLAWPLVCGKDVAKRTRALEFVEGCLSVEVADATWATQLRSFTPRYITGFEALLGPVVKELKFKFSR